MHAALIFVITLIYLSISVAAESIEIPVSNFWIIGVNASTDTSAKIRWNHISEMPYTFVSIPSNTITNIFLMSKMTELPKDNQVLVWSIEIENTAYTQNLAYSELGFIPSSSVASTISLGELNEIDYNQNVIAKTIEKTNTNTVRYTTTVKISNPTSNYIIWRFGTVGLYDTSDTNRIITELNVYESIEDAAGSGVTPEEMREVLSSWSEEELIPGIGDAVGDKIEEVVPDAVLDGLDEHDNQLKTEGGSVIESIKEQISETITPYFENTDQIRDAIHGGASGIFGYAGTDAVITLPAARNPLTGNSLMWNEYQIDLGMYYNRLPAVLRQLISALLTLLVSIGVIRELLDTVNTILIHREILGMPDDYLKSWTRKDDF